VIFVTLGTQAFSFDRLLRGLAGWSSDEELVVQGGASSFRPPGATWVDYLEYPELVEQVRRARVVVSHAGVGSVITAVREGKRPIVVPRLYRFAEAVDDHQLHFGRRLAGSGLVTLVEDPAELRAAIEPDQEPPRASGGAGGLVEDLRAYLEGVAAHSM
jgi:UDP-N-acetylglucosamine transferase subunit ALG13